MAHDSTFPPWTEPPLPNSTLEQPSTFCFTPLWDINLTWNTEDPDFTRCFHQSVLTYVPLAVLFLGAPFQVSKTIRQNIS